MFKTLARIFRVEFKGYAAMNILYYGLVAIAMAYSFLHPEVQGTFMGEVETGFEEALPLLIEAYRSGNFPLAVALTFSFNLFLGSFVYITLPSLIIPFGGVITGCVRAVLWGIILAPTTPELAQAMTLHSIVLVLEGQGYIIAMFATYLQWKGIVKPASAGEKSRRKAYVVGIKKTAHIYVLVVVLLATSAFYEAFELIYILKTLTT